MAHETIVGKQTIGQVKKRYYKQFSFIMIFYVDILASKNKIIFITSLHRRIIRVN